jgi:hypothetical protein
MMGEWWVIALCQAALTPYFRCYRRSCGCLVACLYWTAALQIALTNLI